MSGIDSIIAKAESFLGIKQGSSEHKTIINFYNEARETGAYQMTIYDPWCAAFVVACFYAAGYKGAVPGYAGCSLMMNSFKSAGRWHDNSLDYTPKKGDVVFFDWNANGAPDHVGIVCGVSNSEMVSIEGNYGKTVKFRNKNLSDTTILGFGTPLLPASQTVWEPFYTLKASDRNDILALGSLRKGSNRILVKALQIFLNVNGATLAVDGVFGNLTLNALIKYQKSKGLAADGVCGKQTWTSFFV